MKQRIVIQVHVESDKCRKKALKIAAVCQGVRSLSLEGESSDHIVVTGDGVDAVCLTNQMRKKFRWATLVSVEDINDSDDGDQGEEETNDSDQGGAVPCSCGKYLPPSPMYYYVVSDSYPNGCCIL